jgi:hypothetical protein
MLNFLWNDFYALFLSLLSAVLAVANIAYAFFSNRPKRVIILIRGLVLAYLAAVYLATVPDDCLHPSNMGFFLRPAMTIILLLFLLDTVWMWLGSKESTGIQKHA